MVTVDHDRKTDGEKQPADPGSYLREFDLLVPKVYRGPFYDRLQQPGDCSQARHYDCCANLHEACTRVPPQEV